MKSRVVKKKMRRILNRELPTMLKLSSIHELIRVSKRRNLFWLKDYTGFLFERFSTSLHKGVITVSEHCCVDGIGFSTWHSALTWVYKQVKYAIECGAHSSYVIDSGHYRYKVYYFTKNPEI